MLFLNKFDIFEKKVLKVRVSRSVCCCSLATNSHLYGLLILDVSFCRCHLMCASGSKITSQFQQENKKLNMHMSKCLHLCGPLLKNGRNKTTKAYHSSAKTNSCPICCQNWTYSWLKASPMLSTIFIIKKLKWTHSTCGQTYSIIGVLSLDLLYFTFWIGLITIVNVCIQVCEEKVWGIVFSEHYPGPCGPRV